MFVWSSFSKMLISLSRFVIGVVGLRWPLRPLPSFSLLLFDGWSFCVWMILTAHQPPMVRAIAFMTVLRPSSCAMSSCACTPVNSFGVRSVDELVVFERLLLERDQLVTTLGSFLSSACG